MAITLLEKSDAAQDDAPPAPRKRDDDALLLWNDHVGRQFSGLLTGDGWTYEVTPTDLGIWVSDTGQRLDGNAQRALAISFVAGVTADMRDNGMRLAAGDINPDQWERKQRQDCDDEYLLLAALGAGGFDKLTEDDLNAVAGRDTTPQKPGTGIIDADVRLRSFRGEIDSGEYSPGELVHRSGQYATPGYQVWQKVRENAINRMAVAEGLELQQRNVLDDTAKHCRTTVLTIGCPEVTAAGYQRVGLLPDVGLRTCGASCLCHWTYRLAPKTK